MKRTAILLLLSLMVFPAAAQEVKAFKEYPENISSFSYYHVMNDPVAAFIDIYVPRFYFQEVEIGKKSKVCMTVRSFYNYVDNKTISQVVISTECGETVRENTRSKLDDVFIWESIDTEEIDDILRFLSDVSSLKEKSNAPTRVYNTRHGIIIMGQGNKLKLRFPDTVVVRDFWANEWTPMFEKAKAVIAEASKEKEVFLMDTNSIVN